MRVACRGLFAREVFLDAAGLRRGKQHVAWDDVDFYHYAWLDWQRPGDFALVSKSKQLFRIAPIFDHYREAADILVQELHPRLRTDPYFRPFAFDGHALTFARQRLALAEISHVEIAACGRDVIVVVHRRGERAEWARVEAAGVADFWLWLDELRARDVTIRTPLELYLPPHLLELRAFIEAGDRLPGARVIDR